MAETTYILTAALDPASFAWLDGLRRQHFPPERNFLSAHLTMFHRLTGSQIERLSAMAVPSSPIGLTIDGLRFLGAGVAFNVRSPELVRLRSAIMQGIGGELSRQDSQKWTPHVTVQNKVAADTAKALFTALRDSFAGREGCATGLAVWEYLGGPWALARQLPFGTERTTAMPID